MKDERGLYYNPNPGDDRARVYVRRGADGEIEFRLWQAEMPEVFEKHPWLPHAVIADAASLYQAERNSAANPLRLYDLAVARELVRQDENDAKKTSGAAKSPKKEA